ncbi:alpha/beta hydrolase family protein [Maribacter arenosus]|uniref:Prolyl oligopeptidase family serine peptidase n=1 Tax=Maribacter arenosus TaxID=1854708 RepID=A0ABR7VG75_9FLAO|nr:prolyl oligopeptidase family serine peptidase [Maribacter arenosus]MBD0852650.1 prolyl oligopeptidase family serine peptidase [Maribacter arenosus]
MKTFITFTFLLLFVFNLNGQCNKDLEMYKHFQITVEKDTINYHIYSKNGLDSISNILLYVQGSGAFPLYQIKREGKSLWQSGVPFDLSTIPDGFAFILISKRGIPFCTKFGEPFDVPKIFYDNESLENRANRTSYVIDELVTSKMINPNKVVIIGHSEGSDVVAKLGTINDKVTHIGYWSGGANTQWFDFTMFIRKDVLEGKITEVQATKRMDSLFFNFKEIASKSNSTMDFWEDNTYRRWNKFSEPAINNLLKIEVPLFVAIGTKDQAVPVESTYLIPIEFIRHKKDNLTFRVYPELDHGFEKELENGEFEDHWNDVFLEFMNWVEKSK